jgi:hypothetical protein
MHDRSLAALSRDENIASARMLRVRCAAVPELRCAAVPELRCAAASVGWSGSCSKCGMEWQLQRSAERARENMPVGRHRCSTGSTGEGRNWGFRERGLDIADPAAASGAAAPPLAPSTTPSGPVPIAKGFMGPFPCMHFTGVCKKRGIFAGTVARQAPSQAPLLWAHMTCRRPLHTVPSAHRPVKDLCSALPGEQACQQCLAHQERRPEATELHVESLEHGAGVRAAVQIEVEACHASQSSCADGARSMAHESEPRSSAGRAWSMPLGAEPRDRVCHWHCSAAIAAAALCSGKVHAAGHAEALQMRALLLRWSSRDLARSLF